MALIADGVTPTQLLAVDSTFKAARVSTRPIEHTTLGQYKLSSNIGLVATQAANGTLFSLRWGDATRFLVLQSVKLQVIQTAAATATITPQFQLFVARAFTASDSAGTAHVLTGNNAKARTSMGTSLVTDARFSAAAAGLTVGTRTLDADAVLNLSTQSTITTVNQQQYVTELDMRAGLVHPVVLAQNEGIVVKGPTVVFGANGTMQLSVDLQWAEVAAF